MSAGRVAVGRVVGWEGRGWVAAGRGGMVSEILPSSHEVGWPARSESLPSAEGCQVRRAAHCSRPEAAGTPWPVKSLLEAPEVSSAEPAGARAAPVAESSRDECAGCAHSAWRAPRNRCENDFFFYLDHPREGVK